MAANRGYLLPTPVNPLPRRCVKIWIPDNQNHIAAFWGTLTDLANYFNWEHETEEKRAIAIEAAQVWEGVLVAAREYWQSGECSLPIELRNNGGMIEWRPDGSAAWTSLGDVCPCPTVLPSPQYNPDIITPDELGCTIAVGLIIWLMDKLGDVLDAITFATSTARAIDAILVVFPPAYLLADQISDMIFEITDATVAAVAAADTVELREEFQKFIYCRIKDVGEMNETVWNELKAAITNGDFGANPALLAIGGYFDTFDYDAIAARARIESYNVPSNCVAFVCDGWEHEFNFANDGGMTYGYFPSVPLYPSGNAYTGSFNFLTNAADSVPLRLASSVYADIVLIYFDLPSPREVTGVEMVGTGSTPSGATAQFYTELWYQGVEVGNNINLGNPTGSANFAPILCDRVTVRIDYRKSTAITPGGNGHITAVTIKGQGDDPFV